MEQRSAAVNRFFIIRYKTSILSPMARHVEFDHQRAVERATQVFWKKGYSNASLRDLLRAMGIGEGSFYNTFKSKKNLYLESLRHYNDTVTRRRLDALRSGATAGEGVRAFFKTVLGELDNPKTPQVCLLAGSLSTDVLVERDLNLYVVQEMQTFTKTFVDRLAADRAAGVLPGDFQVEVAAQVLLTYLQGLFRVIRVLVDRNQMERQIEALLQGLGL